MQPIQAARSTTTVTTATPVWCKILTLLIAILILLTSFAVPLRLFLITVSYYVITAVHLRYFHPLSHIPGPWAASFSYVYNSLVIFGSGQEPDVTKWLHEVYGPVVRISPHQISFNDPAVLNTICNRAADKSFVYGSGGMGKTPSVFSIRDHAEHAVRRKKIAAFYSMTSIKPMEKNIEDRITEWMEKISTDFERLGKGFNFGAWSQYLAYDVVADIAFGEHLGFVKNGRDERDLIAAFRKALPIVGRFARIPGLMEFLIGNPVTGRLFRPNPNKPWGAHYLLWHANNMLKKRLENGNPTGRTDLMQLIANGLQPKSPDTPPIFTYDEALSEILIILAAGSDTTAGTYTNFIRNILTRPLVYKQLMDEISTASALGQLSNPIPTYDEILTHLPFFLACTKESMRYSSPIGATLSRNAPKEGFLYTDRSGKMWDIPGGTVLSIHGTLVGMDEDVYGKDAGEFNPERWIVSEVEGKAREEKIERIKEMTRMDAGFGYGARVCLGKNIAMMQVYKTLITFLREFDVELVEPESVEKGDEKKLVFFTVAYLPPLWVKVSRRARP